MTVRRESARKRVPREAYLVSRMRRYRLTISVPHFTLHERRFTRKAEPYRSPAQPEHACR